MVVPHKLVDLNGSSRNTISIRVDLAGLRDTYGQRIDWLPGDLLILDFHRPDVVAPPRLVRGARQRPHHRCRLADRRDGVGQLRRPRRRPDRMGRVRAARGPAGRADRREPLMCRTPAPTRRDDDDRPWCDNCFTRMTLCPGCQTERCAPELHLSMIGSIPLACRRCRPAGVPQIVEYGHGPGVGPYRAGTTLYVDGEAKIRLD